MQTGKTETRMDETVAKSVPDVRPIDRTTGWIDAWERPEALLRMREERKKARVRWLAMTLFPIAIGLASGLFLRGRWRYDIESGVILGFIAAVLLQLWALPPLVLRQARAWEGTVAKLTETRLPRRALSGGFNSAARRNDGSHERYVAEYAVICRTDRGRRAIRFVDDAERYRYFAVGDRVRFCPALGTFEKFDRTDDDVIYCPVCGAQSAPGHAHCDACDRLLFQIK